MKKILVTTDFSINSKAGIRFAIQLANQSLCELIFYNAIELSDSNVLIDHNYTDLSVLDMEVRKDKLRKFVMGIYKQIGKKMGKVDWVIDNQADVDTSIILYAQKCKADYICMSTRGGGIMSKFMGTNASSLITTSPIPLIVVPHSYRMKPLKSVLYASDFEKIGTELKFVEKFASAFDADVAVYHYDYFIEQEDVKSKLKKMTDKYHSEKLSFHFKRLYAELTLLSHLQKDIRKAKPSIIAMFTKQNRNWFEHFFLSSKTAELGFDTKTPLLVFRK